MNARAPAHDDRTTDRVWQLSGFGAAELADNARAAGNGAVTGVLVLAGFVVLALWLTVGLSLQRDDTTQTQQAEADIGHLALAFAEHGARTLAQADQLARTVRADLRRPGPRADLGALLRGAPGDSIMQISVIGADGLTLASSHPTGLRVDHHDRDYVTQCLRGGAEDSPYISRTQHDDASGQHLMQLARRIDDADGRCSGLVLVALTPAFVTRFHQQASLGAQGVITLIGLDGQIRARTASGGTLAGQDQTAAELFQDMRAQGNGQTRRVSPIDGVERLYAFRKVEGFALIAVAAKGADEVYAAGRARGQLWLALGLLVSLVIAALTLNVLRRARQQAELLQALSLSRQKAELAQELKSRFLLDLADGMRAPMHCILERAELLRDTQGEPHARAQARLIHDAAQQMCDRFSTMFEPSGPATLDPETLSGAALDQTVGGLQVDTVVDRSRPLRSPEQLRS